MKTVIAKREQRYPGAQAVADEHGGTTTVQSKRGFDPQVYEEIDDDQLITLSLKLVIEDAKTPSFEHIVEEAYSSFPERFCFQGHPNGRIHSSSIDRFVDAQLIGKNDGSPERRRQPVISSCLPAKPWRKTPTKNCEAKNRWEKLALLHYREHARNTRKQSSGFAEQH
jgi:hypothetical protein